jgi:hypothetical protein
MHGREFDEFCVFCKPFIPLGLRRSVIDLQGVAVRALAQPNEPAGFTSSELVLFLQAMNTWSARYSRCSNILASVSIFLMMPD